MNSRRGSAGTAGNGVVVAVAATIGSFLGASRGGGSGPRRIASGTAARAAAAKGCGFFTVAALLAVA
jgi:hypothetical protein